MDVLYKENNIFYNVLCFLITENEKLFDRNDARLYWRTVTHMAILYHHFFVALFAGSLENNLKNSSDSNLNLLYNFRLAYLTGWNFLFQTVFLFLALSHDALEWMSKQDGAIASKIRYWRDVIFSGMVVPYTCFVFGMFWSLYAIDRELVFPKVYDEVVPWWFNHCVHTNIFVLLILETILQPRRHPVDKRLELIFNTVIGFSYAIVYYSIYFFAGRWLYNVFGIMNWWQVCLYQVLMWISSYIFYFMQFPINRFIHGREPEPQKQVQFKPKKQHNGESKNGGTEGTKASKQNGGITIGGTEEMKVSKQYGGITHGGTKEMNVSIKNGGITHGGTEEIKVSKPNGQNGVDNKATNNNIDFKTPPFSTKSWSLKYRNLRSQFENPKL